MAFLGCYYLWRGRRIGPVSCAEITRLVDSGMLQPSDDVLQAWIDGGEVWFFRSEAREVQTLEVPAFA
jgi:hypothetical protein